MNKKGRYIKVGILFLAGFVALPTAYAQHKGISFQGVIKLPHAQETLPTRAGLTVNARILSTTGCILREEEFTGVNISAGYINLAIGTGAVGGHDPGLSLKEVMDNSQVISGLTCLQADGSVNSSVTTFNPATSNGSRKFRVSLYIDSMPILADFNMRAVAYAINSESLGGKTQDQFLQTSSAVTQNRIENFFSTLTSTSGGSVRWNGSNFVSYNPQDGSNLSSISNAAISDVSYTKLTNVPVNLSEIAGVSCADGKFLKKTSGSWGCGDASTGGSSFSGGDLSGSSPDPTVTKIQNNLVAPGVPTHGVMTWNSTLTRWEAVAPPVCSAAQVLIWSSATDSFSCHAISGVSAANVSGLSAVAKTGSYNDLTDKPTIPSSVNADWSAVSGAAQILNKPTLGSLAAKSSVDLSTSEASGVLAAARFPALTGDITTTSGSLATAIGTNAVTSAKFRQSTARSVVGVAGNATANVGDIQGTANQVLRVDNAGTALAFGAINLASSSAVSGTLPVANGGTGAATLAANNVILGNGTSAVQAVAPGTSGNVLTSNGTTWVSQAAPGGGTIIEPKCASQNGSCTPPSCPSGWSDLGIVSSVYNAAHDASSNKYGYNSRFCKTNLSYQLIEPKCASQNGSCTPSACPSGWSDLGITSSVTNAVHESSGVQSGYNSRFCVQ